jgi:hypothetical protein
LEQASFFIRIIRIKQEPKNRQMHRYRDICKLLEVRLSEKQAQTKAEAVILYFSTRY